MLRDRYDIIDEIYNQCMDGLLEYIQVQNRIDSYFVYAVIRYFCRYIPCRIKQTTSHFILYRRQWEPGVSFMTPFPTFWPIFETLRIE